MKKSKTFVHRVLFVDDNLDHLRIYVRKYPQLEIHWLPSVLCVKGMLQSRSDFDFVVIDLLGVGWTDVAAEIKHLETFLKHGASIILTSAIASDQSLTNVKFVEKETVFDYVLSQE